MRYVVETTDNGAHIKQRQLALNRRDNVSTEPHAGVYSAGVQFITVFTPSAPVSSVCLVFWTIAK